MNISTTPFSYFGSYYSITSSKNPDELNSFLSLNSLHSKSKPRMQTMTIAPIINGLPISFKYDATYTKISLHSKDINVSICFDDEHRLLIEGHGCGLRLDTKPLYNFEYNYLLGSLDNPYCIINSYKNITKSLVYTTYGKLDLIQELNYDATGSKSESQNKSYIDITPDEKGYFMCVIEDIPTHVSIPTITHFDFNSSEEKTKSLFKDFCSKLPKVDDEFSEPLISAAYILWSSTARPEGHFDHYTIFASNKDFPAAYSWDHVFNALAASLIDKKYAWGQMACITDHQDELGQFPGSVGDSTIRWNFAKPPVQGLFFDLMSRHMTFSKEQKTYMLSRIEKQVFFYLKYKDCNQDGIFEYHHGNDSGQDNSTVFKHQTAVDSPDLSAFIIEAMCFVSKLASESNQLEKSLYWEEQISVHIKKFCDYFIKDNLPVAKETLTGKIIESQGLLPFISIILGKKLPEDVRNTMCNVLLSSRYLTDWGVATEAIDSPEYQDDAYWRGAIWAPSTLLIIEGLERCGFEKEALEVSRRFCNLVKNNGYAENFNAITGEGLRDKSFTWTASTFIYLAAKIYKSKT